MIGWLVAGVCLGRAHQQQQRRDEERRARPPRPVLAWLVFAVFAVTFLVINPATLPVVLGAGIGTYVHEQRRRDEHAAWKTSQQPVGPSHLERADAFERQGMPDAARVERDLHTINGGGPRCAG